MVNVLSVPYRRLVGVVAVCGSCLLLRAQAPPALYTSPAPAAVTSPPAPQPACITQQPLANWDGAAQLVAGISDSIFTDSFTEEQRAAWLEYSKTAAADWNRLKRRYVDRVSAWRAKNLAKTRGVDSMLYPFSGPDATNALAFFPDAREYVLVGLEPVGCIPATAEAYTPEYWPALRRAWRSAVSVGFFKTEDMQHDLAQSAAGGVLPVLLFLIARAGNTIVDVSPTGITKAGTLIPSIDRSLTETRGVTIQFRPVAENGEAGTLPDGARHGVQTLRYFASNLANYRLQQKPGTVKYLESLPSGGVLIKSASYLMHRRYFSQIRTLALAKAEILVEDDSGIPYQFFDWNTWDVRLFGAYDKPIDLFKNYLQEDLKAAFDAKAASPEASLDFPFGYKWRPKESNLLLAVRRGK
jgi:hypothetical protein